MPYVVSIREIRDMLDRLTEVFPAARRAAIVERLARMKSFEAYRIVPRAGDYEGVG